MATASAIICCRQRGFTYIGLLLFIVIGGIALSVIGPVWHSEAQREREKELLFVGEQYAQAIGSYYESSPGAIKQYPASLQDLLHDRRFPRIKRHLRKLYIDPVTGGAGWGLVLEQGAIAGVYSQSQARPLKQQGFTDQFADFANAQQYRDWKFIHALYAGSKAAGGSLAAGQQNQATSLDTPLSPAIAGAAPQAVPPPAAKSGTDDKRISVEACQAAWSAANAQCRAGCGSAAGAACRNCSLASFENYRACLHGG